MVKVIFISHLLTYFYCSPWSLLSRVDSDIYGVQEPLRTRREILSIYEKYADSVLGKYGHGKPSIRSTIKPLLHLFHSEENAGLWRRTIDETVRDAVNCSEVLSRSLPVLPDHVLDSPPPLPVTTDDSMPAVLSRLPNVPSFLQRSCESQSVEASSEPLLDLVLCA
ncbi:hypothetical protein KP509_10G011900 [Ceratopteris richardii]|uniref:Uncharacterized protein n=1 Tax=Ceratopteris richardii TaxID=49495 RepID=A0A8T2TZ72_CERRI|nr:hypothetical protein KP509_10G011900 [Ceratopteris richardii]